MAYLARKNMKHLKNIGSIHGYFKELSTLMLEIFNNNERVTIQLHGQPIEPSRVGVKALWCPRRCHDHGIGKVLSSSIRGETPLS